MGRWAQRSIRGGGPATPADLVITDATPPIGTNTTITFSGVVNFADFDPLTFFSEPSTGVGFGVFENVDHTKIDLVFDTDASGDTQLTYSGAVPGILTPQTVAY